VIRVDKDVWLNKGFTAVGEVRLPGAQLGGLLNCDDARLRNPARVAFNLEGASVADELSLKPTTVEGIVNLTNARVGSYQDDKARWPSKLQLDGFVYASISRTVTLSDRLDWLKLNDRGYSPQIYDQLAEVYRRAGLEEDARKVSIAKQQARRSGLTLPGKLWNTVLEFTVGYGYRTSRALVWLVVLLLIGTLVFEAAHSGHFGRLSGPRQFPFQSFFLTLDLLLPVINLHQRESWIAQDFIAESLIFIWAAAGWILTTAVVLSLSGILRRD
jgi:hypothetical protein